MVAGLLLGLLGFGAFGMTHPVPVLAGTSAAAGQKVVIVVGPASSSTTEYIQQAKVMADQARAEGMRVTEIYTPHATWDAVKQHAQDANLLVYFGHGNGFPSRYGPDIHEDTQDGFGLNRVDGGAYSTDVQYWGADYVRSAIHLAPHAVVVLYRLCYASGNGEGGIDPPELPSDPNDVKVAIQRVDNFAAGFLAAGASDVFAWGWPQKINLPQQLAETDRTMDKIFEDRANNTGSPNAFIGKYDYTVASKRTPGATLHLDPSAVYGHLRALTGDLEMTAGDWRGETEPKDTTPPDLTGVSAGVGSASVSSTDGQPAFSPNGDGLDDRLAVDYTMSEPGSLDTTIKDASDDTVLDIDEPVDIGQGTTTWNGTDADGQRVPDGLYSLAMTPTDRAGNVGTTRTMSVWVLTALSSPGSSAAAIEVNDGDDLASSVRFNATLTEPAAIAWTVVDSHGNEVREGPQNPDAQPTDSNDPLLWNWDGTDDSGNPVPDGFYKGIVSATTNAGTISYAQSVFVGAFRVHLIDQSLKRGKKVKIVVYNTEALSGQLQLTIKQKGLAPYVLALKEVGARNKYSLTFYLASGGAKGNSTWALSGTDQDGGAETNSFTERIH